jgi:hypothetical protein
MMNGAQSEVSSESPPAAKRRDVRTLVGCHTEEAPLGARQQRLSNFLCKQSASFNLPCNGHAVTPIRYTASVALQFRSL